MVHRPRAIGGCHRRRAGDGPVPVIATDDEARADAVLRVPGFLKARLD
jgi:hypothetical protein